MPLKVIAAADGKVRAVSDSLKISLGKRLSKLREAGAETPVVEVEGSPGHGERAVANSSSVDHRTAGGLDRKAQRDDFCVAERHVGEVADLRIRLDLDHILEVDLRERVAVERKAILFDID